MDKALVVYYSRTGTTQKLAQAIAGELGCETEQIVERKDRSGGLGWVGAAKDASLRRATEIDPVAHNPADYDLVVVGTPVWAFSMSCPVRTYLQQQRDALARVAFFLTTGGSGIKGTFEDMQQACGKEPVATLGLKTKDVLKDRHMEQVLEFAAALAG